jgi:histidinol dehydrogenase
LLAAVAKQLSEQCESLSRKEHLAGVLEKDAFLVLVKTLPDAVRLCNEYAPEHVSVMTQNPGSLAKAIYTAGAIFLGPYSPVAAGDFMAGPSHTLPTGGGGKSFPGLMADMFQRRTSWVRMDEKALRKSLPIIAAFSELEGLDAHARSAAIRINPHPRELKPEKKQKTPLPVS